MEIPGDVRILNSEREAILAPDTEIVALVDALATDARRHVELPGLLREDHEIYAQRGSATVARRRGWILLAIARVGLTDDALLFVVEELDTGLDPYPVAAAARALRTYPYPSEAFAPFLLHALTNMAGGDETVSFERDGSVGRDTDTTTATREIIATITWLAGAAQSIVPRLEALRQEPGAIPRRMRTDFDRALSAIRAAGAGATGAHLPCCGVPDGLHHIFSWRSRSHPADSTTFEDHLGERLTFEQFFTGQPSIVVFFYTRCDNPLKCSLTVTKLAQVQRMLQERRLDARIRTAAITYDPGFDSPARLRAFGERRGLRLGADHRMLRSLDGMDPLRRRFRLGVNFIDSLVNRHRIEAYVLDGEGQVACSFERLRWDEREVVDRAAVLCDPGPARAGRAPSGALSYLAPLPAVALACLPTCPLCWATYLSAFGIAGLERFAGLSWMQPLLLGALLINVAGAWFRSRATGRSGGVWLAGLGALAVIGSRLGAPVGALGVGLTLAGSLIAVFTARRDGDGASTASGIIRQASAVAAD